MSAPTPPRTRMTRLAHRSSAPRLSARTGIHALAARVAMPRHAACVLDLLGHVRFTRPCAAAVLITVPFLGLGIVGAVYLASIPYTVHRHNWLTKHPEAWGVPVRERRAIARAARSARRLGLRSPLRHRVAGRASAVARAVRRFGDDPAGVMQRAARPGNGRAPGPAAQSSRNRLRLGLRRARRR